MNLTHAQQDQALTLVAAWLGPRMGYGNKPAPTGRAAAYSADGPMLDRAWQSMAPGPARPAILLEGGPTEWAIDASLDSRLVAKLRKVGVRVEAAAGYALHLYPEEW